MSIDAIKDALPDYAKDLKLNLSNITREIQGLSPQQQWGTALASAIAAREPTLRAAIAELAEPHLSPEAVQAAKAAQAIMGMNNIYYRALHLLEDEQYMKMPANLRMNVIANPGIEKADFELYSLAVSAVNGCGMCLQAHEKVLKQAGLSREAIQNALRIASVIHAVAVVLEDERNAKAA